MTTIRPSIALLGFYHHYNYGDDLMQECLSEILSVNDTAEVKVFSDHEWDGAGVKDGHKREYLQCDAIVIGGGGIVAPDFWAFAGDGLSALQDCGKPILFLNVNVTPIVLEDTEFAKSLLKLKAIWRVRDQDSKKNLSSIGIPSVILRDVSLHTGAAENFSPAISPGAIIKLDNELPGEPKRKQCLVFVNSYPLAPIFINNVKRANLEANHAVVSLAEYLDGLVSSGWSVTFVGAQTDRDCDDRIVGGLVFNHMSSRDYVRWDAKRYHWKEISQAISESDLVVSTRFHVSAVCVASGVNFIDITHHDKSLKLLEDVGCLEVSTLFYNLLPEKLAAAGDAAAELFTGPDNPAPIYVQFANADWKKFKQYWASRVAKL